MSWNTREATPDDLPAILALEQQTAAAPQWGGAVWLQLLTRNDENWPRRRAFVAHANEALCGFAVVSVFGEVAELETIAVSATQRRQGIAVMLCAGLQAWARALGAHVFELEVRASNAAAIGFYTRLGFTEQGRRPRYYHDPVEDAVLMSRKL